MIKKIILRILKSNRKLYSSIVDEYIKENLVTTKQKSKIISTMKFERIIDREFLDNKNIVLHNCLFINSTLTGNVIRGDLKLEKPYNCIISNNTTISKELEPIEIPDFIQYKR